jgi:hypothetical protein
MTWSLRGVYMALMDKVHLALFEPQPQQHPISLQLKHEALVGTACFERTSMTSILNPQCLHVSCSQMTVEAPM